MRPQKNNLLRLTIALIIGLFFVYSAAIAAKPLLDEKFPEYYLTGDLENLVNFNFNISPGQTISENITIVNNTENSISYVLKGVDSEINNQQIIVFKSQTGDNPNIGKWLSFANDTVVVDAKSSKTIPFKISLPEEVFPGTYYGGISIQKKNSTTDAATGKTFVVQSLTRQVLGLTVNVSGETNKSFQIENFEYDHSKNSYNFTITNKGNVILSFEGSLQITSTNPLNQITKEEIEISKFKILPNNSIIKTIPISSPPLFGQHNTKLEGQIYFFNGITNEDEALETVSKELTVNFFTWYIIGLSGGIILIILIVLMIKAIIRKRYLSKCIEYTVAEEDTLINIAQKFNMPWKKLAKLNRLKPPYSLEKNQKILVHEDKKT